MKFEDDYETPMTLADLCDEQQRQLDSDKYTIDKLIEANKMLSDKKSGLEAELAEAKRLRGVEVNGHGSRAEFIKLMKTAETCPDFDKWSDK